MEQNAQKSFDSFIAVLEDTAQLVGDIADIESAKAEAASLNQHHLLDGYIQTEQAQILKLRGLEQRRSLLWRRRISKAFSSLCLSIWSSS